MNISLLAATVAILSLLTACDKPDTGTLAAAQSVPIAASPEPVQEAPTLSQSDKEKETLKGCTSTATNTPPTVETLEDVQGQMRCIENFLDTNKSTTHWQQAYADRATAMITSMAVIKALSEPIPSDGVTDMATSQKMLMEREKLKKLKSENYHFVDRALQEITISLHYGLFRELRRQGMQMGDPRESVRAANRIAKQAGIWEVSIDEVREDGQFIVTRLFTEKTPEFLIEGYGPVPVFLKIEDDYFGKNGAFSDKCTVYLGVAQTRLSYACADYLTGTQGRQIADSMKAAIKEDMNKEVSRTKG